MPEFDFDAVEFAENPEPRCACVLLLDTSSSMRGKKIDALNEGLEMFNAELLLDDLASKRVEVAIVTFGGEVKIEQDFASPGLFQMPTLKTSGTTPMGKGIVTALELVEQRKMAYKEFGIAYYRPWIFMISDGEPTDKWKEAAKKLQKAEEEKAVAFFAIGVDQANMQALSKISNRQAVKLRGLNFGEMFQWLSNSLTSVSQSKIDDEIRLDSPSGWAVL